MIHKVPLPVAQPEVDIGACPPSVEEVEFFKLVTATLQRIAHKRRNNTMLYCRMTHTKNWCHQLQYRPNILHLRLIFTYILNFFLFAGLH